MLETVFNLFLHGKMINIIAFTYYCQEEEWNEIEEEKEKDYTGLRIANLQIR